MPKVPKQSSLTQVKKTAISVLNKIVPLLSSVPSRGHFESVIDCDRIVIGLGNPGRKFDATRHNVGFDVIERVRDKLEAQQKRDYERALTNSLGGEETGDAIDSERHPPEFPREVPIGKGRYTRVTIGASEICLMRPQTYMNLSGNALRQYQSARKKALPPRDVLIVTDDVHLPFGKLRLRKKGSDGGHNGLHSVEVNLGSNAYHRLKIGVGDAKARSREAHVLSKFRPGEQAMAEWAIDTAAQCVIDWATKPFNDVQAIYNGAQFRPEGDNVSVPGIKRARPQTAAEDGKPAKTAKSDPEPKQAPVLAPGTSQEEEYEYEYYTDEEVG